jgi:hypothetical protein
VKPFYFRQKNAYIFFALACLILCLSCRGWAQEREAERVGRTADEDSASAADSQQSTTQSSNDGADKCAGIEHDVSVLSNLANRADLVTAFKTYVGHANIHQESSITCPDILDQYVQFAQYEVDLNTLEGKNAFAGCQPKHEARTAIAQRLLKYCNKTHLRGSVDLNSDDETYALTDRLNNMLQSCGSDLRKPILALRDLCDKRSKPEAPVRGPEEPGGD